MFIALMVIYLIILITEFIPLYKKKQKKDLIIFSTLSVAVIIINLLQILQIKIPSPATIISQIVLGIMGQ